MNSRILMFSSLLFITQVLNVLAEDTPAPLKCVYLRNVKFQEYMYNSLIPPPGSTQHSVFLWRKTEEGHPSGWWKIDSEDIHRAIWIMKKKDNCLECYTIKSAWSGFHYNNSEPLYASLKKENPNSYASRRPVYTYAADLDISQADNKNGDVWNIEKVPGSNDRIRIKYTNGDSNLDEYLFAGNKLFDERRRNVYTWSKRDDADPNRNCNTWDGKGDWIMEDVICPPLKYS